MKYNVGDRVRIKSLDWYNENKNNFGKVWCANGRIPFDLDMRKYCGKVMTISHVRADHYTMVENLANYWTDDMFECKVEEETKPNIIEEAKTYWDSIKDAWICPEGYIFKDENGNAINATKIVLEKKKKDVNLTQEQINTMVHDSCVLFCKHCGCGIPRDTCTSLGTCKEHDEYRAAIRAHLMEKKKKEYPKTYDECAEIIAELTGSDCNPKGCMGYMSAQLTALQKLLICRNAYWKIAGEELGLRKPWEPDWTDETTPKFVINVIRDDIYCGSALVKNNAFAFPTEEMRDAFYENFKEIIESCKELL